MEDEVVTRVLHAYGMEPVHLLARQKGYRNESHAAILKNGRQVNLIVYKSEPGILERIKRANAVSDYLAHAGFPARQTADRRIISLNNTRYAAIYNYLPGNTISWEAYTKAHIKLLGKTMGAMHMALQALPQPQMTHLVAAEYLSITARMQRYFTDTSVRAAATVKLGICINEGIMSGLVTALHICEQLPGQQSLHMDFVRGNILFQNDGLEVQVSGILDFEKTAYGHPLFDVARTLAFLLVDCKYKDAAKVRKYFLVSGYAKQRKTPFQNITIHDISGNDISILECLLDLFLLHDFYKFLRHNPYESLVKNEHFVRTKHILINRNIISVPEVVK